MHRRRSQRKDPPVAPRRARGRAGGVRVLKPQQTELGRGTTVVSEKLPGVGSAAFGLYFPTGSRDETVDTNGISHLLEHLVFKGTSSRTADEINREIDLLGGVSNAYTTKESICFYGRVLARHLPRVVEMYADMVTSGLPPGIEPEFEREREVILQEISAVEDSPEDLVGDLVDQAFFGAHPLALPVVGSSRAVARLALPELRGHLKGHFVARDLVVAACGDVDHDALVGLVGEQLSGLPSGPEPAPLDAPRLLATTQVATRDLEQVQVSLSAPGVTRRDPRRAVADVLNTITGEGFSSRLFREVRDRRGLAYSVYSSLASYLDSGSLNVYFGVAPERLAEALDVVGRVLAEVRDQGVSDAEVAQAKEHLLGSTVLSLETAGARLGHIAERALVGEPPAEIAHDLAEIEAVTAEQVCALAAELFAAPLALAAVGPIAADTLPAAGFALR